jgi:hypothetical protein
MVCPDDDYPLSFKTHLLVVKQFVDALIETAVTDILNPATIQLKAGPGGIFRLIDANLDVF